MDRDNCVEQPGDLGCIVSVYYSSHQSMGRFFHDSGVWTIYVFYRQHHARHQYSSRMPVFS